MTTLPSWLLALTLALLSAAPILALVLMYLNQTRLTRAFGDRLGIPIQNMEGKLQEKVRELIPATPKQRMSIPVPGAQLFRKAK